MGWKQIQVVRVRGRPCPNPRRISLWHRHRKCYIHYRCRERVGTGQTDRFFTSTQKLVAGIGTDVWVTDEQRSAFWEQVAFYNFVQAFTGSEARCRPTQKMWVAASPAFLATIAELKPQVVVVLGIKLKGYQIFQTAFRFASLGTHLRGAFNTGHGRKKI